MDFLRKTALALVALAAGCVPKLDDVSSIVSSPRVLAVRATPAEAKPGVMISYQALFSGDGAAPIDWAFCTDPVPLDELEPVSPRCQMATATWLVPLGAVSEDHTQASAALPADACRRFGPTPPDQPAGQPAARPVDPDATGGYYQPLRLAVGAPASYVTYRSRVSCGLVGATQAESAEYNRRFRPNANPSLESLASAGSAANAAGAPLLPDDGSAITTVPAGQPLALTARWPSCPALPPDGDAASPGEPCGGAEPYLLFDPTTRALVEQRESLRLSWLATAGRFASDRTGPDGEAGDPGAQPSSSNTWTAPNEPGEVTLWLVLRDDRGGAGWQRYRLRVE